MGEIDCLHKNLDLKNLCHLATKKSRSYCKTKYPTKDQIRKYKKSKWMDWWGW